MTRASLLRTNGIQLAKAALTIVVPGVCLLLFWCLEGLMRQKGLLNMKDFWAEECTIQEYLTNVWIWYGVWLLLCPLSVIGACLGVAWIVNIVLVSRRGLGKSRPA